MKDNIKNSIGELVQNNELANDDLIEIIETCGMFLNLKTISKYASYKDLDYNSVLARIKSGKLICSKILGEKFIIDNE